MATFLSVQHFRVASSALLLIATLINTSSAQNIAITSDGVAVATLPNGRGLITYDADRSAGTVHDLQELDSGVSTFDDVAIDPPSLARSVDEPTFVFALSANSRRVCSFTLEFAESDAVELPPEDSSGFLLSPIGCTSTQIRTSPFVGVSAMGGTVIVSGGTGGVSVFTYDTSSGVIEDPPVVLNQDLGDVGHPDVTLVSPNLAALSTDFRQGFGVAIASFNGSTLQRLRQFDVENTIGFNHIIQPSNFPLVSAVYYEEEVRSGGTYLYVANGPITVQDPTVNGEPAAVQGAPAGFDALTVAVNSASRIAVFGGVIDDGASSALVLFNITDPINPNFMSVEAIDHADGGGRVTSVATSGTKILYVRQGIGGVRHDWALQKDHESKPSEATPVNENKPTDSSGQDESFPLEPTTSSSTTCIPWRSILFIGVSAVASLGWRI